MRCLMCENFSLSHICPSCQELFLTPNIYRRKLSNGIEVLSFYKYHDIKDLLFTKHTDLGYYIYNILATLSFKKFAHEFQYNYPTASIAIDDTIKNGYSHTAILNKHLKSKNIKPLYNRLRTKNNISYSGKSKEFRIMHPRKFRIKEFVQQSVILVDDIITTGTTLKEASNILRGQDKEILFCLTLSDVRIK